MLILYHVWWDVVYRIKSNQKIFNSKLDRLVDVIYEIHPSNNDRLYTFIGWWLVIGWWAVTQNVGLTLAKAANAWLAFASKTPAWMVINPYLILKQSKVVLWVTGDMIWCDGFLMENLGERCAVLCRGRLSPVLAARVYTFLDQVWIPRWHQAGTRLAPGSSEQVLKKKPVDLYLCLYYREMSARIQAEQVTQMIFNIYRTDATGWAGPGRYLGLRSARPWEDLESLVCNLGVQTSFNYRTFS